MNNYNRLAKEYCELRGFKYLSVAYVSDTCLKIFFIDTAHQKIQSCFLEIKPYVENRLKSLREEADKTEKLLNIDIQVDSALMKKNTDLAEAFCFIFGYCFHGVVSSDDETITISYTIPDSHNPTTPVHHTVKYSYIKYELERKQEYITEVLNHYQ